METLQWSMQLLEEAIEGSEGKSAVAFNDFSDKDNWPGIAKHRKKMYIKK